LQTDLAIGVMLPCNVVVYEDGPRTIVIAVDPMETIAAQSVALRPIADEVRSKLTRAVDRLYDLAAVGASGPNLSPEG
jgi:uncharacterized protein (DUF302 family)